MPDSSRRIFTIPNAISVVRLLCVPVFLWLHLTGRAGWALGCFMAASFSDLLDGLAARILHQYSKLGAFLDPVADKVLLTSAFVALTWTSHLKVAIPVWLTVTTLSRDAIILASVAIVNLTVERRVFYPSLLGKLSTASQLVTVGVVLLLNAFGLELQWLGWLFRLALVLSVGSALHYMYSSSARPPRGA